MNVRWLGRVTRCGALVTCLTLGLGPFSTCLAQDVASQSDVSPTSSATPNGSTPASVVTDPTAGAVEQAYVGSNQCFVCHRPQTNAWSESSHAQAFQHLPDQYRQDSACLKCHVTAFGVPNGFVAGTEKDLSMVGCESCHGPGALHVDAAKRFVLATSDEAQIEKEMRETVVKTPPDSVCIACHTTQAHGHHPAYEGMLPPPAKSAVADYSTGRAAGHGHAHAAHAALYSPGYNIKTCGSCHYDQYLHSRAEAHAALSTMVPTKYRDDQSCLACHPGTHANPTNATSTGTALGRIGVSCESCHGASLEHVRFNVQFIHGPRLGPRLEQAARQTIRKNKPAVTCIQCHLEQNHKQHPPFEKQ